MENEKNSPSAAILMDEHAVRRALMRMTHEIIEQNKSLDDVVLVGIRSRGAPLSQMLSDNLSSVEGTEVPLAHLDATRFRDDLPDAVRMAHPTPEEQAFSVTGKTIILVDDVIYTGRTVRAAIEAIFRMGRPRSVQLAVLIDRGHRELPIRPDYVGKNIPTSREEVVSVHTPQHDGDLGVYLCKG